MADMPSTNDNLLLRTLQDSFTLSSTPFSTVADKLGWSEDEVLTRIQALQEAGFIRKFGAVVAPKKMGFVSLLVAVTIPEPDLDGAVEIINSYQGVTHNYLREGEPNVWFTLIETDKESLEARLTEIETRLGRTLHRLPMSHMFKIGVKLDI